MRLPDETVSVKDNVTITFETKPDSIVSLLAAEKNSDYGTEGFILDPREIIDRLTDFNKFIFLEEGNEELPYDNRSFILSLNLDDWRKCTKEEKTALDAIKNVSFVVRSTDDYSYYQKEEDKEIFFVKKRG